MEFEVNTLVFQDVPALWNWLMGMAIVVGIISFIIFLPFAFESAIKPRWLWVIPAAITAFCVFSIIHVGGWMTDEINLRYAELNQQFEERGITRVDLDEGNKTFTAEDRDGKYIDCGMIPKSDTTYKVVCE